MSKLVLQQVDYYSKGKQSQRPLFLLSNEQQQRNSAKLEKALLNMRRSKTGGRRDRYWWNQANKYFSKT